MNNPLSNSYYFDWRGVETFRYIFDNQGLPLVNYGKKIGLKYNPITIAQYGLSRLRYYQKMTSQSDLEIVKACADWLVANLDDYRNTRAFVYDFELDFYGPKAPWISGMAQGEGISFLLRSFQLLGNEEYLKCAKLAFSPFLTHVKQGGVQDNLSDGTIIFEEYPTDPPSHVLNGHIYALLGVYDYATFFQDDISGNLFLQAWKGLANNLEKWDTGK